MQLNVVSNYKQLSIYQTLNFNLPTQMNLMTLISKRGYFLHFNIIFKLLQFKYVNQMVWPDNI